MIDGILLGLCLWCVASSYLAVVYFIKTMKLRLITIGMAEVIKDIHEGKAIIKTEEGGIRIIRADK
jgi:hypothetical protein